MNSETRACCVFEKMDGGLSSKLWTDLMDKRHRASAWDWRFLSAYLQMAVEMQRGVFVFPACPRKGVKPNSLTRRSLPSFLRNGNQKKRAHICRDWLSVHRGWRGKGWAQGVCVDRVVLDGRVGRVRSKNQTLFKFFVCSLSSQLHFSFLSSFLPRQTGLHWCPSHWSPPPSSISLPHSHIHTSIHSYTPSVPCPCSLHALHAPFERQKDCRLSLPRFLLLHTLPRRSLYITKSTTWYTARFQDYTALSSCFAGHSFTSSSETTTPSTLNSFHRTSHSWSSPTMATTCSMVSPYSPLSQGRSHS